MAPEAKETRLIELIRSYESVIVAFSGGVDSSYLAYVSHQVLGPRSHAVTAISPAVSAAQRSSAHDFAEQHGLNHTSIRTDELDNPDYRSNPAARCFHCKTELYQKLQPLGREWGVEAILDGTNFDDLQDFRPGRRAAKELGIISPLAKVGMTKPDLRQLSRKLGLSTWNQPAAPCLSSRFPYGIAIDEEKLSMVDRAEEFLRSAGLRNFRVRHHEDIARIEVDAREWDSILDTKILERIQGRLREIGYRYVTLDLAPFRSGSLNDALGEKGRAAQASQIDQKATDGQ